MTLSLEQFVRRLNESGLLTAADVEAFVASLTASEQPADGQELARRLVKAKKLTAYQAQEVYKGEGKSLVIGNYVLLDKLGQGGMGMVLKAEHKRMKRVVALKVLSPTVTESPEAVRRFQRETVAAARLVHPNIVAAYDADQDQGRHFLVMEYVTGRDLSALVKDTGTLSVPQAVYCILQAARGLQYAHEQGVVHRDVKPSNLLLDFDGKVKVLDLGLARLDTGGIAKSADLTSTGVFMGTVDFMSPEQAENSKIADARSDVYSLGMSLWYLLTGRRCFDADSLAGIILAHMQAPIPSLVEARLGVPPALDLVFRKMVAKQPADRYQSMADVIAALEPLLVGIGSSDAAERSLATKLSVRTEEPAPIFEFCGSIAAETLHEVTTERQEGPGLSRPPQFDRRNRTPLAVAGAFLAGAALILVTVVLLLSSRAGNVSIEITDPEVEVIIDKGAVRIVGAVNKKLALRPGEHDLSVKRGDVEVPAEKIVIRQGISIALVVEVVDGSVRVLQDGKVIGQAPLPETGAAVVPMLLSAAPVLELSPGGQAQVPSLKLDPQAPFTLEAFVTPGRFSGDGPALLLGAPRQFTLGLEPQTNRLFLELHHAEGERRVTASSLAANRRTHVAAVRSQGQVRLYVEGILVAFDEAPERLADSQSSFIIGDKFSGWLEDIRISNVSRYSSNFTPGERLEPDDGTLALYRADEGEGATLQDSSGHGHQANLTGAQWSKVKTQSNAVPIELPPPGDYALSFDGQANVVEIPSLRFDAQQPLTIEAWIHKRIAREDVMVSPIVVVMGGREPEQIVALACNYNGGATARVDLPGLVKPGVPGYRIYAFREPLPEARNHLAACFGADRKLRLYMNGKLLGAYYEGSGSRRPSFPGAFIGGSREPGDDRISRTFNGTLDEMRISKVVRYERDFEPVARFEFDADLLALYHFDEGHGNVLQDSSGNSHHGKIVGAKWVKANQD